MFVKFGNVSPVPKISFSADHTIVHAACSSVVDEHTIDVVHVFLIVRVDVCCVLGSTKKSRVRSAAKTMPSYSRGICSWATNVALFVTRTLHVPTIKTYDVIVRELS